VLAHRHMLPVKREETMTDHEAIGAVIDEMYAMISGPAGPRDWSRQANCFLPDARQVRTWVDSAGQPQMLAMSLADYRENTTPFFAANPLQLPCLHARMLAMTDTSRLIRPVYPMPEFVRQALQERGLTAAYQARPAYQQNDYVGWITRARLPATQQKRLTQMLEELATGDSYMKMAYKAKPGF
jgi:hypothetical protein